jgi:peptidoglycan/xylan/chitin deacetylase (PgdA/CDA1 family)
MTPNLLPNADLTRADDSEPLPDGWRAGAPGTRMGSFSLDDDGRSIHLMGIANFIQTPPIAVSAGQRYCFRGYGLTDSEKQSATRVRVTFRWLNDRDQLVAEATTPWQPVVLWQQDSPPESWSPIEATFRAPPQAETLLIQIHPASDDRIYLDEMRVQRAFFQPTTPEQAAGEADATTSASEASEDGGDLPIHIAPWPHGYEAAVSFSFDWETTMGGLIHSRSVGDPYADSDPVARGMRMREGITTTLRIFEPYGVQATYYANGYTFLMSNTTRTHFLGNPIYPWATTTNRWLTDQWATTPWFAPDPYGTVDTHPAWYFGDLVPVVAEAGHDIQSHTFSHFYGGFVQPQEWREDLALWNKVAAQHNIAPATSLAFPWSSSGGMSDESWDALVDAGITSVTRLSNQSQYNLFPQDANGMVITPDCIPLPGHEQLLACPDFYLTPESATQAIEQINRARAVGGVIDLWAHTEEVISEEQRAAWEHVVHYAATDRTVWVAPLREIAEWKRALASLHIRAKDANDTSNTSNIGDPCIYTITNESGRALDSITVRSSKPIYEAFLDNRALKVTNPHEVMAPVHARQTLELRICPTP